MKTIENKMVQAVNSGKNFRCSNTEVERTETGCNVYLHGNNIYSVINGTAFFTLAGWNTVTTKSRLRALGVDVRTRNYVVYYNGVAINSYTWYEVK